MIFRWASLGLALLLGACGTTYAVEQASPAELAAASRFIREAETSTEPAMAANGAQQTLATMAQVVSRVEPVAERFCRTEHPKAGADYCDFRIRVASNPGLPPNAYQREGADGRPEVWVTLPLLAEFRNDDEMAFVLGHETAHHIARHLEKQEQQRLAGALVLGMVTAFAQAGQAYSGTYTNSYAADQAMRNSMALGASVGGQAYSQTYELESDMLGAYIAEKAGYDPVRGARFFAKRVPAASVGGAMSLWSTHPRSPERVAVVMKASQSIAAARAEGREPVPAYSDF